MLTLWNILSLSSNLSPYTSLLIREKRSPEIDLKFVSRGFAEIRCRILYARSEMILRSIISIGYYRWNIIIRYHVSKKKKGEKRRALVCECVLLEVYWNVKAAAVCCREVSLIIKDPSRIVFGRPTQAGCASQARVKLCSAPVGTP